MSEIHAAELARSGYAVFRALVPVPLLAELRRATDRARELARFQHGPQAQRLQPVARFNLSLAPFEAFRDLPGLREAISSVLSPEHTYGDLELLGVLLEPAEQPWCTRWHRDWRDNAPYLDVSEWEAVFSDPRFFYQLNCPLYDDHSLWVVPGSHTRPDIPEERERFPTRPVETPDLAGLSPEAAEARCREYLRSMPGATQVHLDAGDVCLYRNTLWHAGGYVPYVKRATLHDYIDTPAYREWRTRMARDMEHRKRQALSAKP
jgi:hypothetical protein